MTPAERSEYNKQYYAANKERLKATRAKKIAMSKEVRLESNKEVEYDFTKLYDLLEARKGTLLSIKKNNGRHNFHEHRGGVYGYTTARFRRTNGEMYDLSYLTNKNPEIYEELMHLGKNVLKFDFTSIQVNHNLTCSKHKDKKNEGESLLISFGNYTGGEIMIDEVKHNAYKNKIIFDGHLLEHYNLPHKGNKYSLVFFKQNKK